MIIQLLFILLLSIVKASDWVIIISGANGYHNYRFQAAATSAYNSFVKNGILEKNIIVFMTNDALWDENNPYRGKLYSSPVNIEESGKSDMTIDYSGEEVTSNKILSVLAGNSFSGKRVLRSSFIDTVHIVVFCYGAPGVITLPKDAIFGSDLSRTVKIMYEKGLYKNLILTIDGEGTEFILPDLDLQKYHVELISPFTQHMINGNIFCPPEDTVREKSIGSCLSTVFSYTNWEGGIIYKASEASDDVSAFENEAVKFEMGNGKWSVYDTKFEYIMRKLMKDQSSIGLRRCSLEEDNVRNQIEMYINANIDQEIANKVYSINQWECYKRGVEKFERLFSWNEYTFNYFGVIVNLCEQDKLSF